MKRHLSGIDAMERENGPQKNRKRRRSPSLEQFGDDEELRLDEYFPWHRIRRLPRSKPPAEQPWRQFSQVSIAHVPIQQCWLRHLNSI
ncbi:hypothetical protein [Herbaspirillum sp. B65]|uniref:hypothetical protein n=1 Tax=Herbaspirillum sp. B65 TaxID=137708 RepID=UPI0009FDC3A7|nr:hypothetical protein [Herbaspirillum sp. B65]